MNDFGLPKLEQMDFYKDRTSLINFADKSDGGIPWASLRPSHYAVLLGAYRNIYMLDSPDKEKVVVMKGYTSIDKKDYTTYDIITGEMEKNERAISIRPIMKFDEENKFLNRSVFKMKSIKPADHLFVNDRGIGRIEYGYYPNSVAPINKQRELAFLHKNNDLHLTGNSYTIDSNDIFDYEKPFNECKLYEYELNGERFVLLKANLKFGERKMKFNRVMVNDGDSVWIKVEPITWYASKLDKTIISHYPIISGIPYNSDYSDFVHLYLNKYFLNEIVQGYLPIDYKKVLYERKKAFETYIENVNDSIEELESINGDDITYEDTIKYEKIIKRLSNYSL